MHISRLFEIIHILLNKKSVTASELAEHFEVSQRTIYRDIEILNQSGIPVYTNRGRGGGISLLSDYVLNKSILNDKEQQEILSALQGLQVVIPEETSGILDKMSLLFNKDMSNWIDVDYSQWNYCDYDLFNQLKKAIFNQLIIEFRYYNRKGEISNRKIEPIQLLFKSRSWYLFGYCLNKNSIRLFKLSRIKDIILTEENFVPRSIKQQPEADWSEEHVDNFITLKLAISAEMTYRVYDEFSEEEIYKNDDGSYTVTVSYPEDGWVYALILSFGDNLEVLEPLHARNIIKEKLENSLNKYL